MRVSADTPAMVGGKGKDVRPNLPVSEVLQGQSHGQVFLLEVMSVDSDTVVDELALVVVQEACLAREVGHESVPQKSRGASEDTHQDLLVSLGILIIGSRGLRRSTTNQPDRRPG